MLKSTEKYAETTGKLGGYDTFSDTLGSMKISGSILFNENYAAPWAIAIPNAERLRELLQLRNIECVLWRSTLFSAGTLKSHSEMRNR